MSCNALIVYKYGHCRNMPSEVSTGIFAGLMALSIIIGVSAPINPTKGLWSICGEVVSAEASVRLRKQVRITLPPQEIISNAIIRMPKQYILLCVRIWEGYRPAANPLREDSNYQKHKELECVVIYLQIMMLCGMFSILIQVYVYHVLSHACCSLMATMPTAIDMFCLCRCYVLCLIMCSISVNTLPAESCVTAKLWQTLTTGWYRPCMEEKTG